MSTASGRRSDNGHLLSLPPLSADAITLRPYRPGDLQAVVDTYVASIHSLAAPYYSSAQLAAWAPSHPDVAKWQERLAVLQSFVAESERVLAGFISYTPEGYLDLLFVNAKFARRGVATRLYLRAESAWQRAGVTRATTHASLAARAFFESQGYQVEQEENVECRGAFLCRFAMAKVLTPVKTGNK